MEQRKGFQKLKRFFDELPLRDKFVDSNGKIFINMSWIFTEKLDREIIKQTIVNIMIKNNKEYKNRCEYLRKDYLDINDINVLNDQERLIIQFLGNDNWTKLNVTDKILDNDFKGIPTISLEQLGEEILNVLKGDTLKKILDNVELEDSQKEQIASIFSKTLKGDKTTLIGVNEAIDNSFENLVDYYKYLVELKKHSTEHSCIINQRTDTGAKRTKINIGSSVPRINDLIPFKQRIEALEEEKPIAKVDVSEVDKNGEIIPSSYITYVYERCLQEIGQEQEGYLFICEPLEGNRETRLKYLTKEEFEMFPVKKGEDKFSKITEKYLSMSAKEFSDEKATRSVNHTSLDKYKIRIRFYLSGIRGRSITDLKKYEEHLQDLYKNPNIRIPRYKKGEFKKIIEGAVKTDRTAQEAVKGNSQRNK